MIDNADRAHLECWKQSLLDPADLLIDLGGAGIALANLDPVRLAFALATGASFAFEAGGEQALDTGRLRVSLTADDLDRRLTALRRVARDALAEGDHVLHLGIGLLTWCDGAEVTRTAPLVLWPVTLDKRAGTIVLSAARDHEPRLNPVLAAQLQRDHDLVLAAPADQEGLDLAALFEAAETAALARTGWSVERAARLAACSFARADLASDVALHADALATGGPLAWLTGELPPPVLLASAPDLLAPLEADASQLAAIGAAAAGASFVLHGPPGTGKSQTIANLVAHCTSHGKTVLVVSDRANALDVVQQRLAAVGLGELCLPIYDSARAHHGTRARVLSALSRVLERSYRSIGGPTSTDARVTELRTALDGYVGSLHAVGPLGLSMHEVIGRLVDLRTAPRAPLAEADAPALDRATFERRKCAVGALAQAALVVEPVATHPWRISALPAWSADATTRAREALAEATRAADTLTSAIAEVTSLVRGIVAKTPEQVRSLGALAELASASPRPGVELLTNMRPGRTEDVSERVALIRARGGGTVEVPRDPAAFLALATRHRALVEEVDDRFTDAVEGLDAGTAWTQLKKWVDSVGPLRYVALRAVRTEVRAVGVPMQLETDGALITGLESVIAERACSAALLAAAEPAKRWFGELGGDPLALDLPRIEAAVAWGVDLRRAFDGIAISGGEPGRQAAWRALVAQVAACSERAASTSYPTILRVGGEAELGAFARLADAVARWQPAIAELAAATGIGEGKLGLGEDHLGSLREQIEALGGAIGSLGEWTRFHLARRDAIVAGVGPAVTAIDRGDLGAGELAAAWERATLLSWADAELSCIPALARFSGATHHTLITAFADLDRGSLAFARARAVAKLGERVPRGKDNDSGELALLVAETKTQTVRSLRCLLSALPTLLPRLAPCVLATPQAIAQHLDPALPLFDVVVFDEASRLATAHALGALVRGRSVIIVGDTHQLLPQRGAASLLDDALAAQFPQLALSTHYRSRHEDLFALANRRYYGDALQVLPASYHSPDLGISLRLVEHSRAEAEAIVTELIGRLRDPQQRARSLAIIALSRGQQDLIEDVLDAARAADPALDALIEQRTEPLLIGTPDRLQGEERDVVLISIGGGAAALALTGAERWLAVAITRAREQMITFSSVGPEAAPEAAHELIALLAFAKAGGGAGRPMELTAPATSITAAIARALTERGWIVRHQVGCGPFAIDLAIVDPNDPDRYVLAIEHDGATYANAPFARDRDRLRAQRLGELGWRMHRIWALDWWLDAPREIQRAHGAIVAALAASRRKRAPVAAARPPRLARASSTPSSGVGPAASLASGSAPVVALTARAATTPAVGTPDLAAGSGPTDVAEGATLHVRIKRGSIPIGPYTAALIPAGRRAPDDMFAARHLAELGKIVDTVLAAEAPMHLDLLARRVGAYFGVGRVTERVLEQMLVILEGRGKFGDEPGIVWRLDQDPTSVPAVRVAGSGAEARRDITEVPLSEVASAVRIVVERTHHVAANELVRDSARLLGFARLTEKVSDRVAEGVRLAAHRQLIAIEEGRARLPD